MLFQLLQEPPERFRMALVGGALRRFGGTSSDARGRLYLNVGHTGLDSESFSTWVSDADVRPVYFVHDLIPLTHPQFCRPGEAERHKRRMRTVLSTASGVIGNSRATLDDLARFGRDEGLPSPPGIAAWLGTTAVEKPVGEAGGRPTFIALGTIEGRKNHLLLLDIWSRLVARMGANAPRLLIIGQRGWEAEEVFRILDGNQTLAGHVIELNQCSDKEIAEHLASARALLFPSKAEGYGLPLIEAIALGTPAIASDLPAFREIGQGVPLLLDPEDQTAWEAAILDFAQAKSAARAEQLRRLEHFQAPTWDAHFRTIEDWLVKIDAGRAAQGEIRSAS
jgi:glycosyltransferase involved in cell wall biosynthesis